MAGVIYSLSRNIQAESILESSIEMVHGILYYFFLPIN
jgi:hypothetical protein